MLYQYSLGFYGHIVVPMCCKLSDRMDSCVNSQVVLKVFISFLSSVFKKAVILVYRESNKLKKKMVSPLSLSLSLTFIQG